MCLQCSGAGGTRKSLHVVGEEIDPDPAGREVLCRC